MATASALWEGDSPLGSGVLRRGRACPNRPHRHQSVLTLLRFRWRLMARRSVVCLYFADSVGPRAPRPTRIGEARIMYCTDTYTRADLHLGHIARHDWWWSLDRRREEQIAPTRCRARLDRLGDSRLASSRTVRVAERHPSAARDDVAPIPLASRCAETRVRAPVFGSQSRSETMEPVRAVGPPPPEGLKAVS